MLTIKKKLAISCILLIIWACLIFFMSSMNTYESNSRSKLAISGFVEKVFTVTNNMGLTHKDSTDIQELVDKLNYPLRKLAHITEYFILTILLIITLANFELKGKKVLVISLFICFIYAFTDEYHQVFVDGRTAQFLDVLVDTFGGVIACGIVWVRSLFKKTP